MADDLHLRDFIGVAGYIGGGIITSLIFVMTMKGDLKLVMRIVNDLKETFKSETAHQNVKIDATQGKLDTVIRLEERIGTVKARVDGHDSDIRELKNGNHHPRPSRT